MRREKVYVEIYISVSSLRVVLKMLMLFIVVIIPLTDQTLIVPYSDPTNCASNQYFQYSRLQCVDCNSNQSKSKDSLSCICKNGTRYKENKGGPLITCEACPGAEITSTDGWSCVKCTADDQYYIITKTCKPCSTGKIMVDQQESGSLYGDRRQKCISCVGGTQPGSSERVCNRCDQNVLSVTSTLAAGPSCSCPVGTETAVGMFT